MASPKSGTPGSLVPPAKPQPALDADVADPGQVAQTKADQQQSGTGKYGSTPIAPSKKVAPETPDAPTTWVQLQVLDQDNKPVPGIRYSIKDADGKVSEGTLGSDGDIMMAGIKPGKVDVTFPDFDADAITE